LPSKEKVRRKQKSLQLVDTREFAMSEDTSLRIIAGEGLQQLVEGMFLLLSTRIGSLAVFIQTSFIDYA
jgi:hypothetical protein